MTKEELIHELDYTTSLFYRVKASMEDGFTRYDDKTALAYIEKLQAEYNRLYEALLDDQEED